MSKKENECQWCGALCIERNLLDLATDFASPQVFNVVRTAYERKGDKKGKQQSKIRRKSSSKMKKTQKIDLVRE